MIPELGQFILIMTLGLALIQSIFPLIGAQKGIQSWVALAKPAARVQLSLFAITCPGL